MNSNWKRRSPVPPALKALGLRIAVVIAGAGFAGAAESGMESLYAGFRNPPVEYSVSPYWFWNGRVRASETRRQIGEMVKQGVHSAVVMNWAGLEPAYLSEDYWREVGAALDAARSAGLTLNFSDEYLWPSGQAWDASALNRDPSRVLQLHPEYRKQSLTCREVGPGTPVALDATPELAVAARLDASGAIDEESLTLIPASRNIDWKAPEGNWKIFVYTAVPSAERNTRVDVLNPAAVRVFIDLVYGEFARRFPQHLGSTIKLFLSDHEGSYGAALPFTPSLWDTFRQRHGYDLRRMLPLATRNTPRAIAVRQDYFETISYLYATSFVGQITDWCKRHGVQHGHSDIEESLLLQVMWTGDMFRLWRASSAVYIDALIERARMPVDFKEAGSVAHFEGRPLVVENQGLTGHDSYWSLEKARRGTNMCLLWGVNRLIPHYFEYDPTHVQYPPSWFLTQPLWRYFHHYADTVRRGLFMNAQGRHNAPVAVYHPLESAWAGGGVLLREGGRPSRWNNSMDQTQDYYSALQLELARQGWDYHILDSHYMQKAEVSGSTIRLAGESFRVLILPPMTHIAGEAAAQIRRFAGGGGLVLALGPQPAALDGVPIRQFPVRDHPLFMERLNYTEQIQVPQPVRADLEPLLGTLRERIGPEVEIVNGSRDHLFFSRRFTADAEWYWAVNDSPQPRRVTVRFPAAGAFEKWDAETAERFALPSEGQNVTLDFGPWDAYFVVRFAGASNAQLAETGTRRVLLALPDSGWQFTPEAPVRVPYARVEGSVEPVWLAPERLANRNWWLAGPYPYGDLRSFFDPSAPERDFDSADPAWKWFESPTPAVHLPERGAVYYAFVKVWSPVARRAWVAVAVSDNIKLWWNEKLELTAHRRWPFVNLRDPWSYRQPIEIRQGWNSVRMKIGPRSTGAAGFLFRITDEDGSTLRDIVYSRDGTLPPRKPRRVHLFVEAPPGTAGGSISRDLDEDAIPERPVTFAPRTAPFTLASWTDSALAHYSGTAIYETGFTLDEFPSGERLILDLGAVGLAAEVWINGEKAGERVWRPFEIEITKYVRRGPNRLRVRVANSDAGWMAQGDPIYARGDWGITFASERDRLRTLRPNGLEGPVRILTSKTKAETGVR